jgi:deazaflavin-dependent oxidoreductase (nitroreductase family)
VSFLGVSNPFVRAILRSPLHGMPSSSLLLVTYTGRKSGQTYTIPVMYAEGREDLLVYVGHSSKKVWWRNLKDAARVRVRLRGTDLEGTGAAISGTEELRATYLKRSPRAAKSLDADEAPIFVRITALRPIERRLGSPRTVARRRGGADELHDQRQLPCHA